MSLALKGGIFALALLIFQYITSYVMLIFGIDGFVMQTVLSYAISFGIPLLVFVKTSKKDPRDVLFSNPLSILSILLIIVFSFLIQPTLYFLSGLSSLIFPNEVSVYLASYTDMGTLPLIFCIGILPAVFEELCYRGAIFSSYGNVGIKKAALMCGFIFAIAHLSAQQFLYAFFMGVIFSLMVYYTKSVYSSMICHFITNSLQVIMLKAAMSSPVEAVAEAESTAMLISQVGTLGVIAVASLPLLVLVALTFVKVNTIPQKIFLLNNENILQHNPDKAYEEKAITVPVIVLTVFYILVAVVAPLI